MALPWFVELDWWLEDWNILKASCGLGLFSTRKIKEGDNLSGEVGWGSLEEGLLQEREGLNG